MRLLNSIVLLASTVLLSQSICKILKRILCVCVYVYIYVCVCWFVPYVEGANYEDGVWPSQLLSAAIRFPPPSLCVCNGKVCPTPGPCVLGFLAPNLQSDTCPLTVPPMDKRGTYSAKRKLKNSWWEPRSAFPGSYHVHSLVTQRIQKCKTRVTGMHSVGRRTELRIPRYPPVRTDMRRPTFLSIMCDWMVKNLKFSQPYHTRVCTWSARGFTPQISAPGGIYTQGWNS